MTMEQGKRVKMDEWITGNDGEDQFDADRFQDYEEDFGECIVNDCDNSAEDEDGFCGDHHHKGACFQCAGCEELFDIGEKVDLIEKGYTIEDVEHLLNIAFWQPKDAYLCQLCYDDLDTCLEPISPRNWRKTALEALTVILILVAGFVALWLAGGQ